MMKAESVLPALCLALGLLALGVHGVNVGDETFNNNVTGVWYAFADRTIHVISADNRTLLANITTDQSGSAFSGASGASNSSTIWNDGVFLQKPSINGRFVLLNEGDTYTEANGTAYTYTLVIDTDTRRVIGRVKVGARSVHLYAIKGAETAWVRSDAEGTFYVINITSKDPFRASVTTVQGYSRAQAHGKLVLNDVLYPIAYGTNVGETVIQKFDLTNNTRIGSFNFSNGLTNQSCGGTHSAWYSRVNRHIYLECSSGSGIIEWNVQNDTLVAQHNISGTLTGTPGDDRIFATVTADRYSTMISPAGRGEPSEILRQISLPSQPGDPAYYSNSTSTRPEAYSAYTLFFPTARNTNLNNIRAVGNGNILSESYYRKPTDCTYDEASVSASSVSSSSQTGLRLSSGSNQTCGACAPGIATKDPSQFNATLAGFRVFELGSREDTGILVSAGAVAPALALGSNANQCSFAAPYRVAKRGGPYVATVADFPQPSIYFLLGNLPLANGSEFFIRTASNPKKIVYVPAVSATAQNVTTIG